MICPNCQNEIPEGTIYCEHCGQEIQIVPDYNMLEDDVLPHILEEKPKAEANPVDTDSSASGDDKEKKEGGTGKKSIFSRNVTLSRMAIFMVGTLVMITIAIVAYSVIDSYLHSYSYILEQATTADDDRRYESAIGYYNELLEKDPENIELMLAVGRDYYRIADYDNARLFLDQVIEADGSNKEAFEMLLKIYDIDRDYEAMEFLTTKTKDEEILAMIDEYLILPPSVSEHGGEYDDDLTVSLRSSEGYEIRYTLDGSEPEEGEVYEEPIEISDGMTVLRAVCIDKDGKAGFELLETYTVHYEAPAPPSIAPESGTYNVPVAIEIYSESKNVEIYYAWDDENPTIYSNKYYGPIEMPVGNHILSVIAINSHGLSSEIERSNYDYEPVTAVE